MFVPGTGEAEFKLRAQIAYLKSALRNTHNARVSQQIQKEIRALEQRLEIARGAKDAAP